MIDNDLVNERRIRSYLADHGGSVHDAGGRGLTDEMARELGIDKPSVLSAVLGKMEGDGVITREMRGLRTFRISLASAEGQVPGEREAATVAVSGAGDPASSPNGRRVSLRGSSARPTTTSVGPDTPASPGSGAVSLHGARSRRPAAPTVPSVVTAPSSSAAPADPPADASEPPGRGSVSLRDAIARQTTAARPEPPPAPPAPEKVLSEPHSRPAPPTARLARPVTPSRSAPRATPTPAPLAGAPPASGGRARSLREALAGPADDGLADDDATDWSPGGLGYSSGSSSFGYLPDAAPDATLPYQRPARPDATTEFAPEEPSKRGRRQAGGKAPRARRPRPRLTVPVPAVKSEPSSVVVAAVGVAVVGLALVTMITVAVIRGSTHHVVAQGNVVSSNDACNVVTSGMASTLFGDDAGPAHFVLGDCVYDDGVHELIVQLFRHNAKTLFDSARSASATDVPGIGDAAYYADGGLRVLKGSNLLEVTLGPNPASQPTPAVLAMTNAALTRL